MVKVVLKVNVSLQNTKYFYQVHKDMRQRVVTLNLPINSSFVSLIKWSHSDDLLLLIRVLSLSNLLPLPASSI